MLSATRRPVSSPAFITMMSVCRVALGILSQVLIAFYFGTLRQLDIYLIAFACPSLVLGIVTALFGPGTLSLLNSKEGSPERLERVVSTLYVYVVAVSLILGLGGMRLGTGLLGATTGLSGMELELGGSLAGLMWLVTGLETMNGFLAALCRLRSKFFMPAALNSFSAVAGTIGGAVFLTGRMGVAGLVVGWLAADLLMLVVLSMFFFRDYRPSLKKVKLTDPDTLAALRKFVPITVTILPFAMLPLVDAFYASMLPAGSMSYLGYSTRAVAVMSVLVTGGIYALLPPGPYGSAGDDGVETPASSLRSSLRVAFAVAAPVALFCYFYRGELVSVILKRGLFDARSAAGVTGALPYYLLGLVAMCLAPLTNRVYAARGRYGRLCLITLPLLGFYIVAAGALSQRYSYAGIGMAYASYWSLFLLASAAFSGWAVLDHTFLTAMARTAVNSVAAVSLVYMLSRYMPFSPIAVLALCLLLTGSLLVVMNRLNPKGSSSASPNLRRAHGYSTRTAEGRG